MRGVGENAAWEGSGARLGDASPAGAGPGVPEFVGAAAG